MDGQLRLADPRHTGDRGQHDRPAVPVTIKKGLPEPAQFDGPAGEAGQILRQPVLDPYLRCRPGLPADHLQRLPPLRHIPHVRMQRLHHRHDQIGVQPPPTRPETVHHGGLPSQLTGRPTRRGPGRVDPVLDPLVRRVTGPDLQQPQPLDQIVEAAGLPRVGRHHEPVNRFPPGHESHPRTAAMSLAHGPS